MKKIKFIAILSLVFAAQLLLIGCERDDAALKVSAPVLTDVSIGFANSKVVNLGSDFHVAALINAEYKIDNIKIEVTPKNAGPGWVLSETFIEGFRGAKNAEFHEHFDVPLTTTQGEYDFLLIVTDEKGNKTEIAETIEIIYDPELPLVTDLNVKFKAPSTLSLMGNISAKNKVSKIVLQFASSGKNKSYVLDGEGITGLSSFVLNKDVDISEVPSGHHHFFLEIHDEVGKKAAFESHFDN